MGRNSTFLGLKKILNVISDVPKNVNFISVECGCDRLFVGKYLGLLAECGFLSVIKKGKAKLYFKSFSTKKMRFAGIIRLTESGKNDLKVYLEKQGGF